MARDDLHFRLRIPEELKNKIEVAAQENRRSMTAEIVHRLEESFTPDGSIGGALSGDYVIPEDTPDEEIDRAIHNAIAKALKSLGVRRGPKTGDE